MSFSPLPNCQLHAVAAMAQNRVIGRNGSMPWHIPADLKFFKRITSGHPIIMGRKTWDSLGRPLPNRRNIILSRTMEFAPGAEIVRDLDELTRLDLTGDVYIIGGAEIYRLLMPVCSSIYLTRLNLTTDGDTYFPEFEADFPACELLDSTPDADWLHYRRR